MNSHRNTNFFLTMILWLGVIFSAACSSPGDDNNSDPTNTDSVIDSASDDSEQSSDSETVDGNTQIDDSNSDDNSLTENVGSDVDSNVEETDPSATDTETDSDAKKTVVSSTDSTTDDADDSESDSVFIDSESDSESATSETEDTGTTGTDTGASVASGEINVRFKQGSASGGPIVYVMWLENSAGTFIQNLFICKSLLNGSLTGTALPYWQMNKKANSETDGITGATVLPEVSITRDIASEATDKFTVYMELDHSYDENDWFSSDQPALVYGVDVDLNSATKEYTLDPIGWTPMSKKTFNNMTGSPSYEAGELCTEMRYITHSESNNNFGDPNPDESATGMVDILTVRVN